MNKVISIEEISGMQVDKRKAEETEIEELKKALETIVELVHDAEVVALRYWEQYIFNK